ncbi:MAG: hypothetical protein AAFU69_11975 [Pseudomonadota bacterium]
MAVDPEMLVETNLSEAMVNWQTWSFWLGWLASLGAVAVAALTAGYFYANYQVERGIPSAVQRRLAELRETIPADPVSTWPDWFLHEEGWESREHPDGLKVFVLKPSGDTSDPNKTGVLFRQGQQTLVWANVISLGDRYVWPYGQNSDVLEDGDNTLGIADAIAGTGLADVIRGVVNTEIVDNTEIDVVGVGLESSHGGDPNDVFRKLSDLRGQNLIAAAKQVIEVPFASIDIRYRSLGIGRALIEQAERSDLERRQRSALLLVVARFSHDHIQMPLETALSKLVSETDLGAINVSEYEYSCAIVQRLSSPLVDDPNLPEWTIPELSVTDDLALRPCNEPQD